MRPTRKAAAKATMANRKMSLSSISSPSEEEDEIESSSEMEMNDDNNELSEEDDQNDLNEFDDQPDINALDEEDELESLSEEEDLNDDLQDEEQPEIDNEAIEEPDVEENADDAEEDEEEDEEEEDDTGPALRKSASRPSKRKKPAYENSDEEEELIFSDEDETEILRNKPMTKRQRAKMNRDTPEEYLELPMDTGKKKFLTEEEEQLRRSEVARRRKNQSIQRAEKDKADTINRLLKKQATKSKRVIDDTTEDKESAQDKLQRLQDPNRLRYINNKDGCLLNIPSIYKIEQVFGLPPTNETDARSQPRKMQHCQVDGCTKDRKYTAKKSGKAVCSLEHYRMVEAN